MCGSVITVKKEAGAFVVANKEIGVDDNADKLSTWPCLEIRMQVKVTVKRTIIDPLKWWNSSNNWEKT